MLDMRAHPYTGSGINACMIGKFSHPVGRLALSPDAIEVLCGDSEPASLVVCLV